MTAPDFLPVLSYGSHDDPSDGACLMEYCSMVAGEKFTDKPECVHPVLATVARLVNDGLTDDHRQELLPLAARLLGTAYHSRDVSRQLVEWMEWMATELGVRWHASAAQYHQQLGNYTTVAWSATISVDCKHGEDGLIAFLTGLCDEFDRLTGHTPTGIAPEAILAAVEAYR